MTVTAILVVANGGTLGVIIGTDYAFSTLPSCSTKSNSRNDGPGRADLCKVVKTSDQSTLGILVDLFDWMDGLSPQPMKEVVSLYEQLQAIETKSQKSSLAATMQAEIEEQKGKL